MDNFVIYFDEVTNSLDISYFLSSSQIIHNNNEIISYINYSDLTAIFLFGLFTSLCTLTFCCTSKKIVPNYILVQQEPLNNKIMNV
jgi:hypothetical protein